jgi:propanol-preferring alcohol dehydrogenase
MNLTEATTIDHRLTVKLKYFKKTYKITEVATPGKDLDENDMLVKVTVGSLSHGWYGKWGHNGNTTTLHCIPRRRWAVVRVGSAIKDS